MFADTFFKESFDFPYCSLTLTWYTDDVAHTGVSVWAYRSCGN